jgi:tripartite-type tricarboxylate transporter receptor subunit TctC
MAFMKALYSGLLSAALVALAGPAVAQENYPTKPIRIVSPYAPGGSVGIIARIIIEPMREILGQPIILDAKPGGFGIIAGQDLLRAPADGYTFIFGNVNSHAVWPVVHRKKFPFDFAKEIIAVAPVADVPGFVAATAKDDFPPRNMTELLDYARAHPGKVRYGSIGVGSFPHFDMEMLARKAGAEMTHVPSKGGAGIVQDLATGDTHVSFANAASTAPLLRAGTLRALAANARTRIEGFPDVPTLAEQGHPEIGTHHWLAIFARRGTPEHVIAAVHKAANEAVKRPEIVELLRKQTMSVFVKDTPEEARAWHKSELDRWEKIVAEIPVKIE